MIVVHELEVFFGFLASFTLVMNIERQKEENLHVRRFINVWWKGKSNFFLMRDVINGRPLCILTTRLVIRKITWGRGGGLLIDILN